MPQFQDVVDESWKEPSKSSNKKGTFSSDNTADIGKIDFIQEQKGLPPSW